ncbi:alpha/beta-hydrolase [Epithele typhae]|uniref:alpha/beta-hydrolase n=1 Tax=Epithele typhae TaxID=378194 RepID=UPI0020082F9E|nr:alpha/beta-hydrolase [Epithele typhae]KAH9924297.1 alpha/beta-hydrolase [Epithele typhae]
MACENCVRGALHTGTPVGNETKFDGVDAYGNFKVILPDLFNGSRVPLWALTSLDKDVPILHRLVLFPAALLFIVPFVLRNRPRQNALITSLAAAVRASAPPGAAVGFLFDAAAACHPSGVSFPADLALVERPFSLATGVKDPYFGKSRAEEAEKKWKEMGLEVEVVVYDGVEHGWTTRADLKDPVQRKARDDVVSQVLTFFTKYLIPKEA